MNSNSGQPSAVVLDSMDTGIQDYREVSDDEGSNLQRGFDSFTGHQEGPEHRQRLSIELLGRDQSGRQRDEELASAKCETDRHMEINYRSRSPLSQAGHTKVQKNTYSEAKLQPASNVPLLAHRRDFSAQSNQSFFSRVMDDFAAYRTQTRLHNEENIDAGMALKVAEKEDEETNGDDNFRDQNIIVSEFTLKAWDFYLYIIGMLVRIQTIVLGYITFAVETENTCVVVYESNAPLSKSLLPENLDMLPGGFSNVSRAFQTIIMMLFITSVCTSIMYINKVIRVIKYHRASREEYMEKALPAVRKYKIWNSIFGLSHLACCTVFMTHAGRVCSGWTVSSLPDEERENLDRELYLFARGGYFIVASIFGLCNLIGFLVVGKNAIN